MFPSDRLSFSLGQRCDVAAAGRDAIEIEKAPIGVGAFGLSSPPELRNQRKRSTMPSPDGTAFVVSEDEGVGAFYYFPCENEVGFALLNF